MPITFHESEVEGAALDWLAQLGYAVVNGKSIEPEMPAAERDSFHEVVLGRRLRAALERLNPHLPASAIDDAFRRVTVPQSPALLANNRAFHRLLIDGVPVEYASTGRIIGEHARLVDFADPDCNDWLAVSQFTVVDGQINRRPDIVLFLNGLPIAVFELKNAADASAGIWHAFNQLQTYKQQISALFVYNALLVISDGVLARIGTLTADRERFGPWRAIEDDSDAFTYRAMSELQVLIDGVFEKRRLLDLLRHFIVFEDDGSGNVTKKVAGYHQFHAVQRAVRETVAASQPGGDRKVGVIWHTQGSGKSLTMAFYAGRVVLAPAMNNPTLVVLTDRNDLDEQLFGTFSRCSDLLRQTPVRAESRSQLRDLLKVASGGVVFATIQKFNPDEGDVFPVLSARSNIVVIADEAHRSQYGFGATSKKSDEGIELGYGFAKYLRDALPNASFIGFTGTPIEKTDANTRQVFGDYISVYDIQRAVQDGATVPILYESRLAKIELKPEERPRIDAQFDEVTEGEEVEHKEKLKSKWAALEALVGAERRIRQIAQDLVQHFENRQSVIEGKAMIVCMSRRICVALYDELIRLRPDWHSDDDSAGQLKVVMTGSASDELHWQGHIRSKARREALAKRFKNPADSFKIVIVRDMWLTGFDAPCMHTMYVDKPMGGHNLMQAIARVNRVFRDKPGGLVVDYIGLANQLREALATYTESGGKGMTAEDIAQAVAVMEEKYDVCRGLMHGFDGSAWKAGSPAQRLSLLPAAQQHLMAQDDGTARWVKAVDALSKAFALATPHEAALAIRDDVGFFQAVKVAITKTSVTATARTADGMDYAIRQIVSQAIVSDQVIDIFTAAGLKRPDFSILSDEFLAEVRGMEQRNLAFELLARLLNEEIKQRGKRNLVQSRSFAEMLEQSIRAYQNRAMQTAQVIEELIAIARDLRERDLHNQQLGLMPEEVAFYDALSENQSAREVLGDDNLRFIAREVTETVRKNVSLDWTVKENVRAKLRVMVKRVLRKYGYPPDLQEKATQTVLEQAEWIAAEWA
jgi:type I restriction enzyme R subunit